MLEWIRQTVSVRPCWRPKPKCWGSHCPAFLRPVDPTRHQQPALSHPLLLPGHVNTALFCHSPSLLGCIWPPRPDFTSLIRGSHPYSRTISESFEHSNVLPWLHGNSLEIALFTSLGFRCLLSSFAHLSVIPQIWMESLCGPHDVLGTGTQWKTKQTSPCLDIFSCYCCCLVAKSCLALYNPMDSSPPGSSVHEDSPGKNTGVGCHSLLQRIFPTQRSNPCLLLGRWILYHWATWEGIF